MTKSKQWYDRQLKDPRWQKCRLRVFHRDNFTCTLCGDDRTTLNIHHEQYAGKPWEIPLDKIKTVCAHCHSVIHAIEPLVTHKIEKQISLNTRCWEIVAYTHEGYVFLYLFFSTDNENDKTEIIKVFTTLKQVA